MNDASKKITDVPSFYAALQGEWQGRYHLWLDPSAPEENSDSSARIAKDSTTSSWVMSYQWSRGPKDHQGEFRFDGSRSQGTFHWTDSFHAAPDPLQGEGKLSEDGNRLTFMSHYPVGEGLPDWGWRTELMLLDVDTFQMDAYNITPEGQEALAVRCRYEKK